MVDGDSVREVGVLVHERRRRRVHLERFGTHRLRSPETKKFEFENFPRAANRSVQKAGHSPVRPVYVAVEVDHLEGAVHAGRQDDRSASSTLSRPIPTVPQPRRDGAAGTRGRSTERRTHFSFVSRLIFSMRLASASMRYSCKKNTRFTCSYRRALKEQVHKSKNEH